MKRYLTSEDCIISFDELVENNEDLSQGELDCINNLKIGEVYDEYHWSIMRITDGEHISSHDDVDTTIIFSFENFGFMRDGKRITVAEAREYFKSKHVDYFIMQASLGKTYKITSISDLPKEQRDKVWYQMFGRDKR